jgi:hypothetical protein
MLMNALYDLSRRVWIVEYQEIGMLDGFSAPSLGCVSIDKKQTLLVQGNFS